MNPIKFFFFGILLLTLTCVACKNEDAGTRMAKKWCECNHPIVNLQKKLSEATDAETRSNVLDSLRSVSSNAIECVGGEASLKNLESSMSNAERDAFNKTFRRISEEQCPDVFKAIADMEASLQNLKN